MWCSVERRLGGRGRQASEWQSTGAPADASGEHRNATAAPTSSADSSFCTGALAYEYLRASPSVRDLRRLGACLARHPVHTPRLGT